MAFQISAHGSRDGVIKHIQAATARPENSKPAQDQLDAVKSLLVSEINAIPTDFNGVRVDAQGDCAQGGRQIQVTVIPMKLHL